MTDDINERLGRALKKMLKPGVDLGPEKKDIPYYRAYPKEPKYVIQRLNGIERIGDFDDEGNFVERIK